MLGAIQSNAARVIPTHAIRHGGIFFLVAVVVAVIATVIVGFCFFYCWFHDWVNDRHTVVRIPDIKRLDEVQKKNGFFLCLLGANPRLPFIQNTLICCTDGR